MLDCRTDHSGTGMKKKTASRPRTAPECSGTGVVGCQNADASGIGLDADAQLWLCDEWSINADQVRFSFINNQ
jgi:hypothetical protein